MANVPAEGRRRRAIAYVLGPGDKTA
jgi:hypothetical protein